MAYSTTLGALCERVKRDATLGTYGPIYTLDQPVAAVDNSIVLAESPENLTIGSTIAINYELLRVRELSGTNTVGVVRAQGQTVAPPTHDEGTVVEVDPRIPLCSLRDWAEHEIRSWKPQLWRTDYVDLSVTRQNRAYELIPPNPQEILFLLEARAEPVGQSVTGTFDNWGTSWFGDGWAHTDALLLRGADASTFPSGWGIQFTTYPRWSGSIRLAVATDFDLSSVEESTDLITDVGLEPGMLEILEYGLRWRALSASMTTRTDWRAMGVLREPDMVSLTDVVRSVDMARSQRDTRFAAEALALRARWPYRRR